MMENVIAIPFFASCVIILAQVRHIHEITDFTYLWTDSMLHVSRHSLISIPLKYPNDTLLSIGVLPVLRAEALTITNDMFLACFICILITCQDTEIET